MPPLELDKAADPNNRARLLRAATDAFAEYGYEGASLRTIAENAGVSFQLITYYFGTKEELWLETVEFLYERYFETGRGLGFTASGNVFEQFHNHLRLLLTDILQRPQMRKIYIQEYLAGSERYRNVIQPKMKQFHEAISLPYYEEVVRLGIVRKYSPEQISLLFSGIVQNNIVYPYLVELLLGVPVGSPKSIEIQVDLVFDILTENPAKAIDAGSDAAKGDAPQSVVVYPWKDAPANDTVERDRIEQLETENRRLKELIGDLSLEKKVLLEILKAGTGSQPVSDPAPRKRD